MPRAKTCWLSRVRGVPHTNGRPIGTVHTVRTLMRLGSRENSKVGRLSPLSPKSKWLPLLNGVRELLPIV